MSDKPQVEKEHKGKKRNFDWLKEYHWQKGQSGNPNGRPKGKSMKDYAREFLQRMSEEARVEFLNSLDPDIVWRMAEGNPHQTTDVTTAGKPVPILNVRPDDSNQQNNGSEAANQGDTGGNGSQQNN